MLVVLFIPNILSISMFCAIWSPRWNAFAIMTPALRDLFSREIKSWYAITPFKYTCLPIPSCNRSTIDSTVCVVRNTLWLANEPLQLTQNYKAPKRPSLKIWYLLSWIACLNAHPTGAIRSNEWRCYNLTVERHIHFLWIFQKKSTFNIVLPMEKWKKHNLIAIQYPVSQWRSRLTAGLQWMCFLSISNTNYWSIFWGRGRWIGTFLVRFESRNIRKLGSASDYGKREILICQLSNARHGGPGTVNASR